MFLYRPWPVNLAMKKCSACAVGFKRTACSLTGASFLTDNILGLDPWQKGSQGSANSSAGCGRAGICKQTRCCYGVTFPVNPDSRDQFPHTFHRRTLPRSPTLASLRMQASGFRKSGFRQGFNQHARIRALTSNAQVCLLLTMHLQSSGDRSSTMTSFGRGRATKRHLLCHSALKYVMRGVSEGQPGQAVRPSGYFCRPREAGSMVLVSSSGKPSQLETGYLCHNLHACLYVSGLPASSQRLTAATPCHVTGLRPDGTQLNPLSGPRPARIWISPGMAVIDRSCSAWKSK